MNLSYSHLRSWIFGVLLLTVALSPLPFGSVYQWSWAGIAVIVGILLLLWTVCAILETGYMEPCLDQVWLPGLFYLCCLVWVFLQASSLTPESWHHPIWQETSNIMGVKLQGIVSVDPYDTESSLLQMISFAGIFWLSAQCCRGSNRPRTALWVFGTAGTFYALYGLIADPGTLLGIDAPTSDFITGTFVNRNMFAFYMALSFLVIGGLLTERLLSVIDSHDIHSRPRNYIFRADSAKMPALLCISIILLVALGLTGSRAGAISLTFSFGILLACLVRSKQSMMAKPKLLIILSVGAVMAIIFALAGMSIGGRAEVAILELGDRWDGYLLTLSAVKDAPWHGFGAGAFPDVYYLYSNGYIWNDLNYSHNLYLGSLAEFGLPAAAALFAAIISVVFSCFRGLKRRRRYHLFPALGVAAGALVAIHGLVDSPLVVPANAVAFSFLLGLAYAQSWPAAHPSN